MLRVTGKLHRLTRPSGAFPLALVRLGLNEKDRLGRTALHSAADKRIASMVSTILARADFTDASAEANIDAINHDPFR